MVSTRIKNSRLNISANIIIYFLQSILSFVVRTVFIRKMGAELLGLDSLLINVLTMLSIAELGFSTAISYELYKPLANHKINKISAYMSLYKKIYYVIGIIIILVGIILSIFLEPIIGDYSYEHLYLVYFLYLFNTASLYFISYKDVLLLADQKNYKIFKYNCFFNSLIYILQFIFILLTKNYIFYILVMILCRFANRIIINRYITNYYKDIDFNSKEKLSKEEISSMKENIFGIFCFKIGDYVINSTDNIILSSIISIVTVGIYTNYLSITTILKTMIKNIFNGITASFGNLTTQHNMEAEKNVYNIMVFIGFVAGGYATVCFLNLINPFMEVWLGPKYVFESSSMIIICINFYLMCNQMPLDTIKEAKGFYTKDKYIPIAQAVINIVLSIVLGIKIGLNGVLLGTTISYLVTVFWIKPLLINKVIFKTKSMNYFINQIKYIITIFIVYIISNQLIVILDLKVNLLSIITNGILTTAIFILIISIFYFKNEGFQFLLDFIKNIFKRKKVLS